MIEVTIASVIKLLNKIRFANGANELPFKTYFPETIEGKTHANTKTSSGTE